jgi:hypothetical protein
MPSRKTAISLDELLRLHALTRELAAQAQKQLRAHLDAMAPLFRPRRFLGDYMEGTGREPVAGAERTWAELQELYKRFAAKPFDLRPELANPLPSVPTQLALLEWEYPHSIQTEQGWQEIRITSPLTWVLAYASPHTLGMVRQQIREGQQQKDPEAMRAFVLRACLMAMLFHKFPAMTELLGAMRYRVEVRTARDLGDLPLLTISAPFDTFRPSDDMVVKAAGFAGGASFTEVVNADSLRDLRDPLREEALRILEKHGETA